MTWTRERDLLIAQTMTFVQSITGKKPEQQVRTEARIEFAPVDQIETAKRPIEIVHEVVRETGPAPRPSPALRGGFREEIQSRVAAFRAHQQLFSRERDAYCDAVLKKVRTSIGNRPKPPGG